MLVFCEILRFFKIFVVTKSLLVSDRLFILGGLHQPATQGFSSSVDFFDMTEGLEGKWRKSKNMSFKRGDFMLKGFQKLSKKLTKSVISLKIFFYGRSL